MRIADGTFILTAEKDGIHAENADDEEKGYIYIADGDFTITSDGDGMDASNIVQIEDGTLDITAGGGAANSLKTHESDVPGGPGGGMPQNGEKPDGESMPQMGKSRMEKICHRIPQLTRAAPAQKESRQVAACT